MQNEDSAKYDGMPRSTIATGLVDFVLPPAKMPEQLIMHMKHELKEKYSGKYSGDTIGEVISISFFARAKNSADQLHNQLEPLRNTPK